ncbi:MAG: hypothetical protein JWM11_3510 [Planctomycetaceae bacterium]|nr:hypothetical protein [Planctomycetaceae bacterium]
MEGKRQDDHGRMMETNAEEQIVRRSRIKVHQRHLDPNGVAA